MTELLDPKLLTQLERLQLRTRRRLAGRFAGEHRSKRFGNSLDFADQREYHPGDDYRRIDYAAGVDRTEGRKIYCWGTAHDGDKLLAEAECLFIAPAAGMAMRPEA